MLTDLKDFKTSIYKVTNADTAEKLADVKQIEESKKTKRLWKPFLATLDTTGELCNNKSSVDQVKYSRCVRAEMMSKYLDGTRYIDYSRARNVSFVNRHRHKFSDWIIPNGEFKFFLSSVYNCNMCIFIFLFITFSRKVFIAIINSLPMDKKLNIGLADKRNRFILQKLSKLLTLAC